MVAISSSFEAPGVYLVGEYLGIRDARAWTDRNGASREPVDVRLLVGASVVVVQYPTRADAVQALQGAIDRDVVALRVFNRHGVKDGRAWQFYAGPRGDSEDREGAAA